MERADWRQASAWIWRSEEWQIQAQHTRRRRGDESSVYPGGSPLLPLTGTEMPNKATSLELFGRKVCKCTDLLPSCQVEDLINRICETG